MPGLKAKKLPAVVETVDEDKPGKEQEDDCRSPMEDTPLLSVCSKHALKGNTEIFNSFFGAQ